MSTLTRARETLSALTARALQAQVLLAELKTCAIWLDAQLSREHIADNLWGNDGCLQYDSPADLLLEVREEIDTAFSVQTMADKVCFAAYPFDKDKRPRWAHVLGLSYVCVLAGSEGTTVVEAASGFEAGGSPVQGLSPMELQWLVAVLDTKSLALLNAMQDMLTALSYAQRSMQGAVGAIVPCDVVWVDHRIEPLLAQLCDVLTIPGIPPAPSLLSSSNRRLRALPPNLHAGLHPQSATN